MTDARDFELDTDVLSGYLDDELDASTRSRVEARLADSPDWRAELAEVRAARDAVRGLPAREAPEGFWDAVTAYVTADGEGDRVADADAAVEPLPLAPRRRRRVAWIAAAAAVVVGLMVTVVALPRRSVTPNVTAVVAQHGGRSAADGDPVSNLAPVGPLLGFRR